MSVVFFLQMFCASHEETLTLDYQKPTVLCDSTCRNALNLTISSCADHRMRPVIGQCVSSSRETQLRDKAPPCEKSLSLVNPQ